MLDCDPALVSFLIDRSIVRQMRGWLFSWRPQKAESMHLQKCCWSGEQTQTSREKIVSKLWRIGWWGGTRKTRRLSLGLSCYFWGIRPTSTFLMGRERTCFRPRGRWASIFLNARGKATARRTRSPWPRSTRWQRWAITAHSCSKFSPIFVRRGSISANSTCRISRTTNCGPFRARRNRRMKNIAKIVPNIKDNFKNNPQLHQKASILPFFPNKSSTFPRPASRDNAICGFVSPLSSPPSKKSPRKTNFYCK